MTNMSAMEGDYAAVKQGDGTIRVARVLAVSVDGRPKPIKVEFPSGHRARLSDGEFELLEVDEKTSQVLEYLFSCVKKDVATIENFKNQSQIAGDLELARDLVERSVKKAIPGAIVEKIHDELIVTMPDPDPIPMILTCPSCGGRHVDEGDFETKPHHTHACQHCGMVWRPAKVCTVGVQFLPGYKNEESS